MTRSTSSLCMPLKYLELFPCLFAGKSSALVQRCTNPATARSATQFTFFHIQLCAHHTGCMVVSHSLNPLWCVCCEWLQVLMPRSFQVLRCLQPGGGGENRHAWLGWERFPWVAENEENSCSCSASRSFSCYRRNAGSCPAVSLSLSPCLSLLHTHTHTHSHSLLSLSLPFFPQPSPFSLQLPDEVSAFDCWLLAAQFASALFLSLPTHTHTHSLSHTNPSAQHTQTHTYAPHHTSHEYLMHTGAFSSFRVPHFKQIWLVCLQCMQA